jgi:mitochondrial fission protein ELM1
VHALILKGMSRMHVLLASQNIAGTVNQCLGIAERLARLDAASDAPLGPLAIRRLTALDGLLSRLPPVARYLPPVVLISCGSVGEVRARQIVRSGRRCLWAHVEALRGTAPRPDLVFVSHHDWEPSFEERDGYVELDGVPHRIDPDDLRLARDDARHQLCLAPSDSMTAVLVGGANPAFSYTPAIRDRIVAELEALVSAGQTVFVTGSRRTDPEMMARLLAARRPGLTVYDGTGENPYRAYLAAADTLQVTEDSISMCCEALATGRPVSLIRLDAQDGPRLEKFRRFQSHMTETLRVLSRPAGGPDPGGRVPDDAGRIAQAILEALRSRR